MTIFLFHTPKVVLHYTPTTTALTRAIRPTSGQCAPFTVHLWDVRKPPSGRLLLFFNHTHDQGVKNKTAPTDGNNIQCGSLFSQNGKNPEVFHSLLKVPLERQRPKQLTVQQILALPLTTTGAGVHSMDPEKWSGRAGNYSSLSTSMHFASSRIFSK